MEIRKDNLSEMISKALTDPSGLIKMLSTSIQAIVEKQTRIMISLRSGCSIRSSSIEAPSTFRGSDLTQLERVTNFRRFLSGQCEVDGG